ncbi:hypothetical protein, partial [Streptomyces sp. NPDC059761]|uniref:hypothetical protein n=1 Tax=Streptomyces sp. NPDC059761 TaxID=3346937 RepID=UPI00366479AE
MLWSSPDDVVIAARPARRAAGETRRCISAVHRRKARPGGAQDGHAGDEGGAVGEVGERAAAPDTSVLARG